MADTVLVVEDEPVVLDFLVEGLQAAGFVVVAARSVAEGFQALAQQAPVLLLTDLRLGTAWDGLAMIAKARVGALHLPIIAISGFGGDALDMAAVAGATLTLAKPFGMDRLLRVVMGVLAGR